MTFKTIPVGSMLVTNCYILEDAGETAIIDPGASPKKLIGEIGANLKYIILTHGHFDHCMAATEIRERFAPAAKLIIHALDEPFLRNRELSRLPVKTRVEPPDIQAQDGDIFPLGNTVLRWIHTPGHTPGSSCVLCENELFTGDTLFRGDCGRCDLPGGDFETIKASLRKLAAIDGNPGVHPGHDAQSDLQTERDENPYMRA